MPRLCPAQDLPEGEARGFDPLAQGQDQLFIVRQGGLHAWRNACPHVQGAPMAWRRHGYLSGDGRHIACHAHGALFDIRSGRCVQGPCLGQALTPEPVHIDPEGWVHWHPASPQETTP